VHVKIQLLAVVHPLSPMLGRTATCRTSVGASIGIWSLMQDRGGILKNLVVLTFCVSSSSVRAKEGILTVVGTVATWGHQQLEKGCCIGAAAEEAHFKKTCEQRANRRISKDGSVLKIINISSSRGATG
jgi:hypothetical protein